MARDLSDVFDCFLPQKDGAAAASNGSGGLRPLGGPIPRSGRPAALPIVSLPIGDRDVVRSAYAWNLAVELARQGASATLIARVAAEPSPLWPEPGRGPVGSEVVLTHARDLGALNRAALDIAVNRAADSRGGGLVLVTVPPSWFADTTDGRALLRWVLLFAATERRDLLETYSLAKRVISANADARVGVTIHGVRRIDDAAGAFNHLAGVAARHLDHALTSYGLLVDDLHVYRAIVSRRPIGIEHPQSRAARALRDVARLLLEDAGMQAVA